MFRSFRFIGWASPLVILLVAGYSVPVRAQNLAARKEEEKQLLNQQDQIDQELDKIVQATSGTNGSKIERDRLLERSQVLNTMRDVIGTRLKDIAREVRETELRQVTTLFKGPVDVFLEGMSVASGNTPIARVTFDDQVWLDDRRLVRLKAENGMTWVVDPAKVTAVRSSPATQPAAGSL